MHYVCTSVHLCNCIFVYLYIVYCILYIVYCLSKPVATWAKSYMCCASITPGEVVHLNKKLELNDKKVIVSSDEKRKQQPSSSPFSPPPTGAMAQS